MTMNVIFIACSVNTVCNVTHGCKVTLHVTNLQCKENLQNINSCFN